MATSNTEELGRFLKCTVIGRGVFGPCACWGSSGWIQSGHTIKSCDFFLNPKQQMQQILILSHPILLLFTFI